MRRASLAAAAALSLALLPSLASCLDEEGAVEFRESDMASLDVEFRWAVVAEPYVACRAEPDYSASVVRNLRKGALERVDGSRTVRTDGKAETWYAVEGGWVPESGVAVYSNRLRAERAASEL